MSAGSVNSQLDSLQNQINNSINPFLIRPGHIMMWAGSQASIPAGWQLCNGSGTTSNGIAVPNLMNRFIVGAGSTYGVGNTGGVEQAPLSISQIPSHTHTYSRFDEKSNDWKGDGNSSPGNGTGGNSTQNTGSAGSGSAPTHENRPPYYALCYIIKM